MIDHFLAADYTSALLIFDEILSKGFNALHFISGLSSHLRDRIVCRKEASESLLQLPGSLVRRYKEQSAKCSVPFLYEALNITTGCEAAYRQSGNQRLLIEFTLMKLSFLVQGVPNVQPVPQSAGAPQVVPPAPQQSQPLQQPQPVQQPAPVQSQPIQQPAPSQPVATEEPAPVPPAPAVSAAPAPAQKAPLRTGSLSVRDMLMKAEQRARGVEETSTEEERGERPFTMEEFMVAWREFIEEERAAKRTSLAITLEQYTPVLLEDGVTVEFYVSNDAQKGWIEEKRLLKMISQMRGKVHNRRLNLQVAVAVTSGEDDGAPKLYTNRDKGEYLLREHESVRELAQKLELDIK